MYVHLARIARDAGVTNPVLCCAPTGIAANSIIGYTIYALFRLLVGGEFASLSGTAGDEAPAAVLQEEVRLFQQEVHSQPPDPRPGEQPLAAGEAGQRGAHGWAQLDPLW